jgi:Ca2+/Na+ antiporter
MSATAQSQAPRDASPRLKARAAGAFYLLAVFTAVLGEFTVHGRFAYAAGLAAVACYMAVTLLLYAIFKPVSRQVATAAAVLNFAGLVLEALRWQPWRVNVAMVFHGSFCLLTGWLILRSTFLPRALGVLSAFAGLDWLLDLSPSIAARLAPANTALGLLGEGLPMLWLLAMGINDRQWREQADDFERRKIP